MCGGQSNVVEISLILNMSSSAEDEPTEQMQADILSGVNAFEDNAERMVQDARIDKVQAVSGGHMLLMAVRPMFRKPTETVRSAIFAGLPGILGQSLTDVQVSDIESPQPSMFDNANGLAPMRAVTGPDDQSIDCWWLTVLPATRWDHLRVSGAAPPARSSHCSVWDRHQQNVVIFGGLNRQGNGMLNDCWYLHVPDPEFLSRTFVPGNELTEFAWKSCAVGNGERVPTPRYGHSGIEYGEVMYVFGGYSQSAWGFASSGFAPSFRLTSDVWALEHYWCAHVSLHAKVLPAHSNISFISNQNSEWSPEVACLCHIQQPRL